MVRTFTTQDGQKIFSVSSQWLAAWQLLTAFEQAVIAAFCRDADRDIAEVVLWP